jgi:hypothetical protein
MVHTHVQDRPMSLREATQRYKRDRWIGIHRAARSGFRTRWLPRLAYVALASVCLLLAVLMVPEAMR